MFQKKCETCNLYVPRNFTCQLMIPQMQGKVKPTDYCSQHNDHLLTCERCGAGVLEPFIEYIDGKTHILCGQCIVLPH